jgi:hypothetical protein
MLRISKFEGTELNAAKTKLPPGKFQVDAGGDHYAQGTWKPRRGNSHVSLAKFTDAVTSLLGFEMLGLSYALAYVEGTTIRGDVDVTVQA